jgi:Kdo2-lipid IVA lauroyltransferase/acyltransferase
VSGGGAAPAPTPDRAEARGGGVEPAEARSGGFDLREGGTWSRRQRWKNDLIWVLARGALRLVRALPAGALRAACVAAACAAWAGSGRMRRRVRASLAAGLGRAPVSREVRRVFARAGETLADTLALLDAAEPAGRTLRLEDESRRVFAAALAEGRGVVFVTAHLGPWERMAALLAAEGFPVAAVARQSYDPRFTELYERVRAPRGVRSIYRGASAARRVIRELRRGGAVGFLADLPGRSPSREATLFGRRRALSAGPASLAAATGAAVVVGTPQRAADGVLEVQVRRLEADGCADAHELLAIELGRRIAAEPEAWLGHFHPELQHREDRR